MKRSLTKMLGTLSLSVCLSCLMPIRVAAWGQQGHQIVAEIALWRLEQLKAKNALKNFFGILKLKPESPMLRQPKDIDSAAVWPDAVRGTKDYSFADDLHFVSIGLDKNVDKDRYNASKQCKPSNKVPEGICVVGALEHYKKILSNPGSSNKARLEALSFIVHFMGDLHQPLHTSEDTNFTNYMGKKGDRGGNYRFIFYLGEAAFNDADEESCLGDPDVCTERFEDDISNRKLHAAWDKYMIVTEMKKPSRSSVKKYALDLEKSLPQNPSDPAFAVIEAGSLASWAEEAHDLAEKNAYLLKGPKSKTSPADGDPYDFYLLDSAYRDRNIKLIDRQLIRAGIRLAAFLKQIYPDKP